MDLTDLQWTIIEPLFEEKRRPDGTDAGTRNARRRPRLLQLPCSERVSTVGHAH
jgi:hypothetical protein